MVAPVSRSEAEEWHDEEVVMEEPNQEMLNQVRRYCEAREPHRRGELQQPALQFLLFKTAELMTEITELRAAVLADRQQPWWRRFLGLKGRP